MMRQGPVGRRRRTWAPVANHDFRLMARAGQAGGHSNRYQSGASNCSRSLAILKFLELPVCESKGDRERSDKAFGRRYCML
jgi:hypothetical protein